MCYSCGSGRNHQTFYPSGPHHYQPQQPYHGGYVGSNDYQIRPPPNNTDYLSSGYPMNRTPSYGSNDSGYATKTPSVASPVLQQSYPIHTYPLPIQGYSPNYQSSQPSASWQYSNQRSPDIEVICAPSVSSSKYKKERRLSIPSPTSPSEYPCLHPNCGHTSSRAHDLKRHMTVHFPPAVEELLDCKYEWCGRTGAHGFKREDHRKEHYRKVHMKESEYPKTGKGGRSGRTSQRP